MELAREAGRRMMCFYGNGAAVIWKKDASPRTAADRASHDFLVNSLQSLMLEGRCISEESEDATSGSVDSAKLL